MHREKTFDLRGNPIVLWIVYRAGTEYAFGTYADALRYARSHE